MDSTIALCIGLLAISIVLEIIKRVFQKEFPGTTAKLVFISIEVVACILWGIFFAYHQMYFFVAWATILAAYNIGQFATARVPRP